MKVTRANEQWGIYDDRRTAAPLSQRELDELLRGPRVHAGLLRWADDTTQTKKPAAQVDDPSMPDEGVAQRVIPDIKRLEHNLGGGDGGASPNDGSPERWPIILPGDKLMNAGEDLLDTGKDVLLSKLPGKQGARRRFTAAPDPYDLQLTSEMTDSNHDTEVHADSSGQRWLVKHPRDAEHWPAALDMATAHLQQRAGLPTPEIHSVDMNGVPTPVHKMIPGVQKAFPGKRFDHASLSPEDIMTLQKHNVLDWMLSNHDAHPGQFIRDPQGQLIGIDKGQAFRYFGKDQLDPGYHPNANYGETEPIYNTMWRNFSQGRGHMNDPRTGELGQFVQNLQSMPDEEFQQTLRPYAEAAAQVGKLGGGGGGRGPMQLPIRPNDPDSFLEHATARKNSLMNDFGDYYDRMAGQQRQFVGRRRAYTY